MNYGIYNKKVFKEIGMYNTRFYFWYADGDLSNRAFHFGYKHKSHSNIKVFVFDSEKNTTYTKKDWKIYQKNLVKYRKQKFPKATGTKDILCMLPKYIIICGFRSPLGQKCHDFGQKL